MKAIVVDDEQLVLEDTVAAVKEAAPSVDLESFVSAKEALLYVKNNKIDIAFLDINMRIINGLEMAKQILEINPMVNIIFCTGYSEYALDAHNLYCSAYLLKPATAEKVKNAMQNLRHPVADTIEKPVIQCFGGFDIFVNGKSIKFKYTKTKELLAFLVDRRGADCKTQEIVSAILREDTTMSYFQNLRRDLIGTLNVLGCGDIVRDKRGVLGINKDFVKCDYYDYLDGDQSVAISGAYMPQYAFGEYTRRKLAN